MKLQKATLFSGVATALLCFGTYAQVGVAPKKDVSLKQTTDERFRVGDVWEYQTRKGEERSRATILRIDDSPELGNNIERTKSYRRIAFAKSHPFPVTADETRP